MKDDISIAFSKSSYYPPYGDQEIPGNRPADLRAFFGRRLGRRYAPVPLNAGCLNNALIAVGSPTPLDPIPALPEALRELQRTRQQAFAEASQEQKATKEGEAQGISSKTIGERPCLMGVTNYILNTRNGGRRRCSPWTSFSFELSTENHGTSNPGLGIPKKDSVPPPGGAASCQLAPLSMRYGTRKGRGVYNFDAKCPTHPAREALAERERQRAQAEAGRTLVAKPLDHSLIELGLWSLIYPTGLTPSKTSPSREGNGEGAAETRCAEDICADSAPVRLHKDSVDVGEEIVGDNDTATRHLYPDEICKLFSAAHRRGDGDSTAAAFHQARRTIEKARMPQKKKVAARLLREDIKLVRGLPL